MPLEALMMPPMLSMKALYDRQREMAENPNPTAFKVAAQLLDQGRTDTPLTASEDMTVRVKVYASGGENELHAHPYEDHVFIVLQGSARFFGADGELAQLRPIEGIMLPKGSLYRFNATSAEPLVLLRVGGPNRHPDETPVRLDGAGKSMPGDSKENKTVAVAFRDGAYFG